MKNTTNLRKHNVLSNCKGYRCATSRWKHLQLKLDLAWNCHTVILLRICLVPADVVTSVAAIKDYGRWYMIIEKIHLVRIGNQSCLGSSPCHLQSQFPIAYCAIFAPSRLGASRAFLLARLVQCLVAF